MLKKILCLALVLCVCIPFGAAFAADDMVEIDWFMYDHFSNEVWQADPVLQYAQEQVGLKVNVVTVPWGECDAKLNLLAASDELPDIYMSFWYPWTQNFTYMLEDELIVDLTDLIPNYPNLEAYIKSEESFSQLLVDDNKIYGIPRYYPATHNWNITIRSDLLAKYDLAVPTSWDELHDALAVIVPAEEIAGLTLKSADNLIEYAHIWTGGYDYVKNADGQYVRIETTDGYREFLRYFKTWYDEGLLDPDFLLGQSNMDIEKMAAGKTASAIMQWNPDFVSQHRDTLKANDPNAEEVILPYLLGPEGTNQYDGTGAAVAANSANYLGWQMINANSEHVEKILEFYDFLLADNAAVATHGVPDVHYTVDESGAITYTDAYYAEMEREGSWNFKYGTTCPRFFIDYLNEEIGRLTPFCENADLINPGWQKMLDAQQVRALWNYAFNSENNINFSGNVGTVISEYRTAFLTGAKDLDADWEEYLTALDDAGYNAIIKDLNDWMAQHE